MCGESVKTSFPSEFAGLMAETMADAGLLLPVMEMGVLELRMADRPGGLSPYDLRRRWRGVASGSRESIDRAGPNMGECRSIESGGLVGREESYATSLNTRSYMEPRCDSETGELGTEPARVVACDQR